MNGQWSFAHDYRLVCAAASVLGSAPAMGPIYHGGAALALFTVPPLKSVRELATVKISQRRGLAARYLGGQCPVKPSNSGIRC